MSRSLLSPLSGRGWTLALAFVLASQGCAPADDADAEGTGEDAEELALTNSSGACTAEQWETIGAANAGASWLIQRAAEDFFTREAEVLRDLWFGPGRNDSELRRMILNFASIPGTDQPILCEKPKRSGAVIRPQTTRCNMPGAYGFYDESTGIISLCPSWFTYPHDTGEPEDEMSKVGALLHEYSHVAGTASEKYDPRYGYKSARTRAQTPLGGAAQNAENWRFYLMRTPANERFDRELVEAGQL